MVFRVLTDTLDLSPEDTFNFYLHTSTTTRFPTADRSSLDRAEDGTPEVLVSFHSIEDAAYYVKYLTPRIRALSWDEGSVYDLQRSFRNEFGGPQFILGGGTTHSAFLNLIVAEDIGLVDYTVHIEIDPLFELRHKEVELYTFVTNEDLTRVATPVRDDSPEANKAVQICAPLKVRRSLSVPFEYCVAWAKEQLMRGKDVSVEDVEYQIDLV